MNDVVLVDGARTPHGTLLGSLGTESAVELGRIATDGLLDRLRVPPDSIDWATFGNAIQAGIGQVPGRQAVVRSNLPNGTPVTTVNEASGSGLRAITLAADRIASGRIDWALAGGFESMTNAPWILPDHRKGVKHGHVTLKDSMILDSLWDGNLDRHMGEITEGLVDRADISRERQDRYALASHRRAATAIDGGRFDEEIVPVETDRGPQTRDEGPRPDSTMDDLAALPPSFRDRGTITPANASKLADGAGVVALASAAAVDATDQRPMCRLVEYALVYRDPAEFNEAIPDAIESLVASADLDIDEIDTWWINEAFAAQSIYVMDRVGIPRDRFNPLGGAIAFGHPIGASGGMLTVSLANQLVDESLDYGVIGMSVGGGGAIVSLWERFEDQRG